MSSVAAGKGIVVFSLSVLLVGCGSERTPDEASSPTGNAETDAVRHAFTYSIIDTTSDRAAVLALIESRVVPMMVEVGATLYSVWLPVELPEEAPFAGLGDAQLSLMLAWPEENAGVEVLDSALNALDGVGTVTTRTFDPIYLAESLHVPTGRGFYVHREERYRPEDVAEAVRLSKEAWETFEPTFGVRVTGLFRERLDSTDVAQLLRIVWYRSHEGWIESREFERDPESRQRFRERSRLQLEGSGVTIATDRALP